MSHASQTGPEIRERVGHPIIDSDGHTIEYLPDVNDRLRALAGARVADAFDGLMQGMARHGDFPAELRKQLGFIKPGWWALPASNTTDRATAMLPRLMRERLDELGIDVAIVYTTYGIVAMTQDDAELRAASCRAFNQHNAEVFQGLGDRLVPVAVVPMTTPEEALAELDHSVGELGFRAVMMQGHVLRPLPGVENLPRAARWMDTFGIDSDYDYEPVWRRCAELGVSPTFHSTGMGWGSRASVSNYVYNHIGSFGAAGEAICRAILLNGVAVRHPGLRFAFLEGGVNWASGLYSDLLGHWEKRNPTHLPHYDPAKLDREKLVALFEEYGAKCVTERLDGLDAALAPLSSAEPPETRDEFRHSGIERPEDVKEIFEERFFFGCEADDPQNATAFDARTRPFGARLNAIFSSDVGHWDVPDMAEVVPEAWELVDDGLFTEADFRDFVFTNPWKLWTGTNREFFAGTVLAGSAAPV